MCIQSIAFLHWKRQERRLTVHEPLTVIEVRHPDGKTDEYRLTGAKAVFGNVDDVDLVLPGFSLSGRKKSFITFSQAGTDSLVAVFSVPVILSGVETRELRLGRDKTMTIGTYQFTYRSTPSEAKESDRSPSLSVGVYSLAAVLITVVCFVPSIPVRLAYPLPRVFRHEQTEFRSTRNLTEEASFDSSEDESLDAIPIEHEENGSSSVRAGMYQPPSLTPELRMEREPSRTEVKTVPPGGHIDAGPFDILFIHAHPDDESLDFGVLMARASRAGKRVAVVILTDGEGGIDQYPRRIVGGKYRPYDMAGSELSQVRVIEARNALSILGCSLYVRLGLRNDSYNGTRDEKTLDAKLDRWGGKDAAVDAVYRLIRELKPTLVVSPDAASRAREHYEHEATGWIVRQAVDKALADLDNTVRAHITSVDPLQRGVYPDRSAVNAMLKDAETGLTYRDIQAQALLEHRTQRDASVIGVEVLKNFRSEFYHVRFWNLDGDIESYLSD
jgi:LmbE family N-acetylglucosaminyl deacetylase